MVTKVYEWCSSLELQRVGLITMKRSVHIPSWADECETLVNCSFGLRIH